MSEQTATGESRLISEGFIAYRERDQNQGGKGLSEVARFTTVAEAVARVKGEGVFGGDGSVSSYEVLLYEGGLVVTEEKPIIGYRLVPGRGWSVGWLDLREYAALGADSNPVQLDAFDGDTESICAAHIGSEHYGHDCLEYTGHSSWHRCACGDIWGDGDTTSREPDDTER